MDSGRRGTAVFNGGKFADWRVYCLAGGWRERKDMMRMEASIQL